MVVADDHASHQGPADDLRADHPARGQLRGGPLRPARPAGPRRLLHRGRALPRTPAASSPAARCPTAASGSARSSKLRLTDDGVDVYLDIDKGYDTIPADALAVVGNRSAVGEQYVELQPQTDSRPYLHDGSQIAQDDTRTPIPTDKLLGDLSNTVESVTSARCSTTVDRARARRSPAPARTSQRIIDTGNSFIHDRQRQLRHHHGPDQATATPCCTGRSHSAERDPDLRPRPRAVLAAPWPATTGPARR